MSKINIEEIIIDKIENTNNTDSESISCTDTDESDYTSIDESEYVSDFVIDDLEKDNIIKKVNILEDLIDNVLDKNKDKDKDKDKIIKNVIRDIVEEVEKVEKVEKVEVEVEVEVEEEEEEVKLEGVDNIKLEKVEKSTMTSYSTLKKGNIKRNNLNNTKQYCKPYCQYKPYCPKCKIHGHNRSNCPIKDNKKHIYEMDIESITNKLGVNAIKLQKNMKAMQEMKNEYIKLTNEKTSLINDHDKLEKMLLEKNRINDLYCEENINLTKVAYANFYKINVNDITLEEIISSSAGFKGWFETTKSCKTKNNL